MVNYFTWVFQRKDTMKRPVLNRAGKTTLSYIWIGLRALSSDQNVKSTNQENISVPLVPKTKRMTKIIIIHDFWKSNAALSSRTILHMENNLYFQGQSKHSFTLRRDVVWKATEDPHRWTNTHKTHAHQTCQVDMGGMHIPLVWGCVLVIWFPRFTC